MNCWLLISILLFFLDGGYSTSRSFNSLQYYEKLYENRTSNIRIGNIDTVYDENDNTIAICRIVEMNRHSLIAGPDRVTFPSDFPLESLAAVSLALEHLNNGDGTVISNVHGLNERCNIRFIGEFVDTAGLENQAVDTVINITSRQNNNLPCAFIGAFISRVSIPTAILTSLRGYPQFSGLATATELDDKETFPLFGRLVPSSNNYAIPLLELLQNQLNVQHLAVIYTDADVGISYLDGIRAAASEMNVTIKSVGYADSETDFTAAVAALKATEYRYFFGILTNVHVEPILLEAQRQGIAGTGDHNWILTSTALSTVLQQPMGKDSPLAKASVGVMQFRTQGALPGVGRFNEYIDAWSALNNKEDIEYLNTKIPQYPNDPLYQPKIDKTTFDMGPFTPTTAVLYDTAIALGLAACEAASNSEEEDVVSLDGTEHYTAMLNTEFDGASGRVSLDHVTGSRTASSALYVLNNFYPIPTESNDNNVTFVEQQSLYYDRKWIQVKPIIFNDNTTNIPVDLPVIDMEYNYISRPLRTLGLIMSAIIIVCSIGFASWTEWNKSNRVVRASQPIFLHILCFGTMLMGASIIPLSLDDEVVNIHGVSTACIAFPWLLYLGWCFAFAALFTKTRRVNQIFHNPSFRRIKVSATDVMKPMIFLVGINVLILSLWVAISPLEWVRDPISDDIHGRITESKGQCTSEHELPFWISLVVVDLGVLVLAIQQAYVARKISTEFAETEWIMKSITMSFVVAFVGVPVLILAQNDPGVHFFVQSAIIFVVCMSLLGFIFVPKLFYNHSTNKTRQTSVIRSAVSNVTNRVSEVSSANETAADGSNPDRDGLKITVHPKLQGNLAATIREMKLERESLIQRIAYLEAQVKMNPATDVVPGVEDVCPS